jgi:hypothetical protein
MTATARRQIGGPPMPKKKAETHFGRLPPQHRFFLNPYADMRFTACPKCDGKTKLRKFPLAIHVAPLHFIALNKTVRYCPYCDLLIAHQDELEEQLAALFAERAPEAIGNNYLVIGTMERPDWKRGVQAPLSIEETRGAIHDFKDVWHFKVTGGWMPDPRKQPKS